MDFADDEAMYPLTPPDTAEPEADGVVKVTASARLPGEDELDADLSMR